MNSRSARAKRRSRQRKLSFNKMPMADELIGAEWPSRIAFSGPDRLGRTQCCIANRTHIMAVGYGENEPDALMSAVKTYIDELTEEANPADYSGETMYGADIVHENEAALAEKVIDMVPAEAEPGTFVGNNRRNPLHYVCPICEQGLNERCTSVRNGIELKSLHAERRRLGIEGAED